MSGAHRESGSGSFPPDLFGPGPVDEMPFASVLLTVLGSFVEEASLIEHCRVLVTTDYVTFLKAICLILVIQ